MIRRQVGWLAETAGRQEFRPGVDRPSGEGWTPVYVDHSPAAGALEADPAALHPRYVAGWVEEVANRAERLAAAATKGEGHEGVDDPGWYVDADRGCLESDESCEPLVRSCDGEVLGSFLRQEDAELAAMFDPPLVAALVPVLRWYIAQAGSGDCPLRPAASWQEFESASVTADDGEGLGPDRLAASRDLLKSLVDEEDCWFDHHGGCQAHGYLSLEPGETCPQAELKALLREGG